MILARLSRYASPSAASVDPSSSSGHTIPAQSLFCLTARQLALDWSRPGRMLQLRESLPPAIFDTLLRLRSDIKILRHFFPPGLLKDFDGTGDEMKEGSPIKLELPASCFVLDADTRLLNFEHSALALEPYLNRLDFFDLCSKLALDQPTERVYAEMSQGEQEKLIDRDPIVQCRALELSPRRAILHYDEVALTCAASGYLAALERSLMRVREGLDTHNLLQRCVLLAIERGHFHIANRIRCDNYSSAFHYFFPDGRVPPQYFAQLLDADKLMPEVGDQIATDLLDWLTKHDIQRLRRHLAQDEHISAGVLHRFDSMYRDPRLY